VGDRGGRLGARVAIGGESIGHQCYAPTLLVDTPDDVRTMREEVFGPVVNVVAFDDLDDAIDRANAVPWAFQAGILTKDVDRALHAGRRLDATAVMVNDHTAFRVDWMPFGGRRHSGLGLGGMAYTMEEMTQLKMLVLREGLP
jgi:acyl-CoA reductase-like NAD-dependent aldehyde dehydrogenase